MKSQYYKYRNSVMIGRVVIPSEQGLDRNDYVRFALETNTVCVLMASGDFIKDCPVVTSLIGTNEGIVSSADFPEKAGMLGSHVVMINIPKHNTMLVIGMIAPRGTVFGATHEKQMLFKRATDENIVSIDGRAIEGVLKFSSTSKNQDGGKMFFDATNLQKKGLLKTDTNFREEYTSEDKTVTVDNNYIRKVFGDITSTTDGNEVRKVTKDYSLEANKIVQEATEIKLGQGATEWAAKGDTVESLLNTIIQQLIVVAGDLATVAAAVPTTAPNVPAAIAQLQALQTSLLKSQKTKIE